MAWHEHPPFSRVPVGAMVEVDFIKVLPDQLIPECKVVEKS